MGISSYDCRRILSQPATVRWAGWETDTLRLQQSGWDLSVEFREDRSEYRLAIRNREMSLYGITYEPIESRLQRQSLYDMHHQVIPPFYINHIVPQIQVIKMMTTDLSVFEPIDAIPRMVDDEIRSLEDLNMFRTIDHEVDVYVEEADMSVLDHLQAIKDLQSPDQEAIRKRLVQARSNPPEIITHANVISIRR